VTLYDRTNPTIKGKPKNLLPTISVRNVQLLYDLPYLQKKIMIKVDPAYLFNFQHALWIFKGQDGPLRKDLKKGAKTLKKGQDVVHQVKTSDISGQLCLVVYIP
jgi:hypothetical protein